MAETLQRGRVVKIGADGTRTTRPFNDDDRDYAATGKVPDSVPSVSNLGLGAAADAGRAIKKSQTDVEDAVGYKRGGLVSKSGGFRPMTSSMRGKGRAR